jgi:geranylgeranyl diphosphate synthase, type I
MPPIFLQYKKEIDRFLVHYLSLKEKEFSHTNQWGSDVIRRLREFVIQGKSIRGSLVLFSSRIYGKHQTKELIRIAAASELIHSGFLIHDDIMDQDRMRRGKSAIHVQYEVVGRKLNCTNPSLCFWGWIFLEHN